MTIQDFLSLLREQREKCPVEWRVLPSGWLRDEECRCPIEAVADFRRGGGARQVPHAFESGAELGLALVDRLDIFGAADCQGAHPYGLRKALLEACGVVDQESPAAE